MRVERNSARACLLRVRDPACGSGNFLYLSLRLLKDFDRRVEEEAKKLGVTADPKGQRITPRTVLGIEVNPYAAKLARVDHERSRGVAL